MAQDDLPQILSDEEFAALLKQREQFDRSEHERWNNAGARPHPPQTDGRPESTLEQQFPHIAQKLVSVWRSEACALYLNELVVSEPERNARKGFPADIVEDFLLLYAINERLMRNIRAAPAVNAGDPWPKDKRQK